MGSVKPEVRATFAKFLTVLKKIYKNCIMNFLLLNLSRNLIRKHKKLKKIQKNIFEKKKFRIFFEFFANF